MTVALPTVTECDRRLLALWARYEQADLDGDREEADRAYRLLDQTLELRGRLAQR